MIVLARGCRRLLCRAFSRGAAEDARPCEIRTRISRAQRAHVRPRVRVYRYPQPPFWEYPRPGTYSYPGPNAKRDCRAWYVVENRPSGAVMTPRHALRVGPGLTSFGVPACNAFPMSAFAIAKRGAFKAEIAE